MAWKCRSEDHTVAVIVEPAFKGEVIALARECPVWIVDSPHNRPMIDSSWTIGSDVNLFEVNRYVTSQPDDRVANLIDILGLLDDHHMGRLVARIQGVAADDAVVSLMRHEGFRICGTDDWLVVERDEAERDRKIGR